MLRTPIIAAAIGSLFVASSSFAGFTLSAAPSAQPATGAGLVAFDLFAQNDANTADGVNLQGVSFTFTGSGTKAFFSTFDNGDGTFGADQYNFGSGASGTNVTDRNSSNLRIGTRTAGQHGFVQYPGDADSALTSDQATNGIATFQADYAALSAASSFPASTAPGARFARLVVNNAGSFTISGFFGGEVGSKSAASISVPVVAGPTNVAPVVVPPAPAAVVFGQIVTNGAPFSVNVTVTDANAADVLSLAAGPAPAGITGLTVAGATGFSPRTFTVSGVVDYSLNGTTVLIPVTASDGTATGTGTVSLVVTPEPASLSLIGLSGLLMGRRRK